MPAKLNIERANPTSRYEIREEIAPAAPRIGTSRTASEPRGPPNRQYSQREGARRQQQQSRRVPEQVEEDDEYPGELYDMYSNARSSRGNNGRQRQRYVEDEDEYASEYDDGSFDENDFEMMNERPAPSRTRTQSTRGQSRRPDIRKIRVKVHADDVRYIMVGTAIEFPDMVDKIRDKFQLRKRFKIKVKDEDMPNGDMITMGDQDDLDMVIMSVRSQAKRERLDMGKLEVSMPELLLSLWCTNMQADLGGGCVNKLMTYERNIFLSFFFVYKFIRRISAARILCHQGISSDFQRYTSKRSCT